MKRLHLMMAAVMTAACASMPMTAAVDSGNGAEVSRQLAQGNDPNAADEKGATPLAYAAYRGRAEIAEELLAHGARVDQSINGGRTPMLIAVWNGHIDVASVLLKHGASLTARGNNGVSALDRAVQSGRVDTVRWVLKLGADINEEGDHGEPLVSWATYYNHPDIVSALVAAGAKPVGVIGRVGIVVGANGAASVGVKSVLPGSPAALGGVKTGDMILEIDGQSTEGLTPTQAAGRLRGAPGASVDLTVSRAGQRIPFSIVRDSVGVGAVPAGSLPPPATKGEWWQQ